MEKKLAQDSLATATKGRQVIHLVSHPPPRTQR